MFDPTALVQASNAQRRLLDSARLDGPTEAGRSPRRERTGRHPVRRAVSSLLIRAGRALEPAPTPGTRTVCA